MRCITWTSHTFIWQDRQDQPANYNLFWMFWERQLFNFILYYTVLCFSYFYCFFSQFLISVYIHINIAFIFAKKGNNSFLQYARNRAFASKVKYIQKEAFSWQYIFIFLVYLFLSIKEVGKKIHTHFSFMRINVFSFMFLKNYTCANLK